MNHRAEWTAAIEQRERESKPALRELRIVVPETPPSGNNYTRARIVTPRGKKPFISWYHTKEAEAWWATVAGILAGRHVAGRSLEVSFIVFLKNRAGMADTDNYAKCCLDAIGKAGAIENDRYVDDVHGHRRIDPTNPRTVILIRSNDAAQLNLEA